MLCARLLVNAYESLKTWYRLLGVLGSCIVRISCPSLINGGFFRMTSHHESNPFFEPLKPSAMIPWTFGKYGSFYRRGTLCLDYRW